MIIGLDNDVQFNVDDNNNVTSQNRAIMLEPTDEHHMYIAHTTDTNDARLFIVTSTSSNVQNSTLVHIHLIEKIAMSQYLYKKLVSGTFENDNMSEPRLVYKTFGLITLSFTDTNLRTNIFSSYYIIAGLVGVFLTIMIFMFVNRRQQCRVAPINKSIVDVRDG